MVTKVIAMTGPVRSAYFMLSSTELQNDFIALTGSGFFSQWNYPNPEKALYSEFGSVNFFCIAEDKSSLIDFELLTAA